MVSDSIGKYVAMSFIYFFSQCQQKYRQRRPINIWHSAYFFLKFYWQSIPKKEFKRTNIIPRYNNNLLIPYIAIKMQSEQIERIHNRIEQHGNPEQLEQLCLDSIEIVHFSDFTCQEIEKCTNLLFLTLNHCEIQSLENFPVLDSVVALEVIGNKIKGTDLKFLGNCPNLQELALDQNEIQRVEDLAVLNSMAKLQHLQIRGNPLCTVENYRARIFELIPKLQIVDCQDVFGDDGVMFGTETESENSEEGTDQKEKEDEQQEEKEEGDAGGHRYCGI